MKKLIYLILAAALMLNCGNKTGKAVSNTDSLTMDSIVADTGMDKHSETYIRQRIDTIYKTVGKSVYDSKGNEVSYIKNPFNRDSAYCSERYYAMMQEALQLCNDWSCKVARIYEMTDSTALVDLDIHNFGDTQTTIALRFERNDWYIDDFSPSKDGNDDKKYLRETIRQGLKIREQAKALVGYWGWVGNDSPDRHPIASRNYEGSLTLRKGYFKYSDGAKQNLSDYAE